ncbi:hypothetical protein GQ57_20120 [Burkholderia sp. MSh2]|uniref:hypothetical protein n=1 Tax=Burkholderia TaxID=32008 RepID=UPI0004D93A20|nr:MULTISPECIES: hypothetical protein [Burkholderia]KEZ04238.1 hypothetical protein GQ57_20120 [Burkholderia sp. MSh2]
MLAAPGVGPRPLSFVKVRPIVEDFDDDVERHARPIPAGETVKRQSQARLVYRNTTGEHPGSDTQANRQAVTRSY